MSQVVGFPGNGLQLKGGRDDYERRHLREHTADNH
jgi:hypothetical protein